MNNKKFSPLLSALACVAALTLAPAQAKKPDGSQGQSKQADVSCEDSQINALACQGPFKHGDNKGDTISFDGVDYLDVGSSDDSFIDWDHGPSARTLRFAEALIGPFVLGLRAGNMYSVYLFDGANGIDNIDFDTWGVVERGQDQAGVLTHAFLLTPGGTLQHKPSGDTIADEGLAAPPTAQQVPEPASGALALAALVAVGLTARRGKR